MAKQSHKHAKRQNSSAGRPNAPANMRRVLVRQQLDEFREQIAQFGDDLCQLHHLSERLVPVLQLRTRIKALSATLADPQRDSLECQPSPTLERIKKIIACSGDSQLEELIHADLAGRTQLLEQQLVQPLSGVATLATRILKSLEQFESADLIDNAQVEVLRQDLLSISKDPYALPELKVEVLSPQILNQISDKFAHKNDQIQQQLAQERVDAQRQQMRQKNPTLNSICEIFEAGESTAGREARLRVLIGEVVPQRLIDALASIDKVLPIEQLDEIEQMRRQATRILAQYEELASIGNELIGVKAFSQLLPKHSWEEIEARLKLLTEHQIDNTLHVVFESMTDLVTRPESEMCEYLKVLNQYTLSLPYEIAPRSMLPKCYPENFVTIEQLGSAAATLQQLTQRSVHSEFKQWEQTVENARAESERLLILAGTNSREASILSHLLYRVVFNWGDFKVFYHKDELIQRAIERAVISPRESDELEKIIQKYQTAGFFKPRTIDPALLQFDPDGKKTSSSVLARAFKPLNKLASLRKRISELENVPSRFSEVSSEGEASAVLVRVGAYFSFLDLASSIYEFDRLRPHLRDFCQAVPVLYGPDAARNGTPEHAQAVAQVERSYSEGFQVNHSYRDDGHKWRMDIGMTYCLKETKYLAQSALQLDRIISELEDREPELVAGLSELRAKIANPLRRALAPILDKAELAKAEWPDSERGFSDYMDRNLWPALIDAASDALRFFEANIDDLLIELDRGRPHLEELLGIKLYA